MIILPFALSRCRCATASLPKGLRATLASLDRLSTNGFGKCVLHVRNVAKASYDTGISTPKDSFPRTV